MADSGRRKRAQTQLTLTLAAGQTIEQAAQTAGVSPRTAYRRLGNAGFRLRLRHVQHAVLQLAMRRLSDAALVAADRLRELLDSESENIRLAAAKSVLDISRRLWETGQHELYHCLTPDEAQDWMENVLAAVRELVPEPERKPA